MRLNIFKRGDVQVVTVALTGPPTAVTAVARTLAALLPVTSMRHTPVSTSIVDGTPHIRLYAICHLRGRS